MSLVFDFLASGCKTVSQLRNCIQSSLNFHDNLPNYICIIWNTCVVVLSGPNWVVSSIGGKTLDFYYSQQARIFVMVMQEILSPLVPSSDAKISMRSRLALHLFQTA